MSKMLVKTQGGQSEIPITSRGERQWPVSSYCMSDVNRLRRPEDERIC